VTVHPGRVSLGIFGAVVKGLLYLLLIGVVVPVSDFIFRGVRLRGRGCRQDG
jgi:hypothetical protein